MTIILDLTTKQSLTHNYQTHQIMNWERMEGCGNQCGQHFPKHPDHGCYELVHCGCKKAAVVDANASRQPSNVQHHVSVLETKTKSYHPSHYENSVVK